MGSQPASTYTGLGIGNMAIDSRQSVTSPSRLGSPGRGAAAVEDQTLDPIPWTLYP